MDEEARLQRIEKLANELHELCGEEPYILVTVGAFHTNAPDDATALALLRDTAKLVVAQRASAVVQGLEALKTLGSLFSRR